MHLLCSLKGPLQKLSSPNLLGIPQPWSVRELKQQRYSGYRSFFLACDEELSLGVGLRPTRLRPKAGETNGSENVTKKVNSRCFKLHCPYSNSFTLSNVGDFFRSWNRKDCILVHKRKKKHPVVLCLHPPQNVKLGSFTCSSCTVTAKKCTKKRDARAKLLFC